MIPFSTDPADPASRDAEAGPVSPGVDARTLRSVLRSSLSLQSLSLLGIFLLGFVYTLHFGRSFFLPIVIAILLTFVLSPTVRFLQRFKLPRPLAAALTLGILLGSLGGILYLVIEPAQEWVAEAPRNLTQIERKLRRFRQPAEQVERAAEQVEELARGSKSASKSVEVREKSVMSNLLTSGQRFLAGTLTMIILLFFLLATDDFLLRKLVRLLPRLSDRKKAVSIVRRIERKISTHLLTVSVINIGLGLAVTGALHLLGMPNPILWGVMAAVLNFIPYVGAIIGVLILTGVSLLTFDPISQALAVPTAYFLLTLLEGGLITPVILGRWLSLNPVVIFLGLFFWGWLWGVAGALLAVPILVCIKISCDSIEILAPVGDLLGR